VRALAPPRARIAVAHGKLKEAELDAAMARFVRGEVDILVSTMIVESGLDVPNANTMIVDRADQLGLAQLYQLRGRVGRSHRRAYCYLLVPDLVDAEAEERLRVLEHHTDLGSGYRIALRDLELRGAGNLLGAAQSGDAQRLLLVSELRALGARVGLEMVLVKDDEARLTFARDASPRLAGLTAALDVVQFEAEVRRAAPLSLRLRRLGGEPIGSGLVRALTAVLADAHL